MPGPQLPLHCGGFCCKPVGSREGSRSGPSLLFRWAVCLFLCHSAGIFCSLLGEPTHWLGQRGPRDEAAGLAGGFLVDSQARECPLSWLSPSPALNRATQPAVSAGQSSQASRWAPGLRPSCSSQAGAQPQASGCLPQDRGEALRVGAVVKVSPTRPSRVLTAHTLVQTPRSHPGPCEGLACVHRELDTGAYTAGGQDGQTEQR